MATAANIYQGSIISLDENGQYVIGCDKGTGVNRPVPFISMKNSFDPDVTTGKLDTTMARSTYSAVGGIITAIPCTAGYELETTEYDKEATFKVNDGVVPGTGTKIGFATVATEAPGGAEPYLGFVSIPPNAIRPDGVRPYLGTRLAFFSDFIPAGFGAGSAAAVTDADGNEIKFAISGTGTTVAWAADADGVLTATLS